VSSDEPVLDPKAIEQLRELERSGSPGFIAELAALFIKQGQEQMEVLGVSAGARDGAGLVRSAHLMKGSCGGIGAMRMMLLCRELEEAARAQEWPRVNSLVERVLAEFSRVREALLAEGGKAAGPAPTA
jgi:HPt (histidine-containing phosphotransfer) domain-containing protein